MTDPTLEKLKELAACGAKELPETIYEAITFPHSSGWDEGCWQCAMRLESAIAGYTLGLSQGQTALREVLANIQKAVDLSAGVPAHWKKGQVHAVIRDAENGLRGIIEAGNNGD